MDARYNLRSNKQECHIPVQFQLARDEEFSSECLTSSSGIGSVFDTEQSDSSISDIDIFLLLDHLNQNLSSPYLASDKDAQAGGSGRVSGGPRGGVC